MDTKGISESNQEGRKCVYVETVENIIEGQGEEERFIISVCNMDIRKRSKVQEDVYRAMVDQGANVNIGPIRLARRLRLQIVPHTDGRKIGTSDEDGKMKIVGWIFPKGYIGLIAIVMKAAYVL